MRKIYILWIWGTRWEWDMEKAFTTKKKAEEAKKYKTKPNGWSHWMIEEIELF